MNTMILVIGANGATGRLVVTQMLNEGQEVYAMVRDKNRLPSVISEQSAGNKKLSIIENDISVLPIDKLESLIDNCHAVVCCVGHNLTFKGVYGKPFELVTNITNKVTKAIDNIQSKSNKNIKFILMGTAGFQNKENNEEVSFKHSVVVSLLRNLLPPHRDNECAASALEKSARLQSKVEWVVIRPDSLINESLVSEYTICRAPTRCAIFDPGKTSRINVADFMVKLIMDDKLWQQWRHKMPVIYNI